MKCWMAMVWMGMFGLAACAEGVGGSSIGAATTGLGADSGGSGGQGSGLAQGQDEPWVSVEHSALSTCGITEGGRVACLQVSAGQLPSGSDFVQVELAGGWPGMGCALRAGGEAVCFAPGEASQRLVDEVPAVELTVLAGRDFLVEGQICGLDVDGAVHCWGDVQEAPPEDEAFVDLDGGGGDFCGLREDGSVLCWEAFSGRRLEEPPAGAWESVSVGDEYACVREGTTVECWGRLPGGVAPDEALVAVEAGEWSVCGLRTNGTAGCWGSNGWGQNDVPQRTFAEVSPAEMTVAGLRSDGTVGIWGAGLR